MYQKNCSLPAHVWSSVTIIIHLFVLGDFIFEASHEECDVTKFNQLNSAAWILPGELSSVLCVCEYLSKSFIRITTVKGVTTIEGIETMFCLWSILIIFTKLFHQLWIKKFKNDWTKRLQKIPRKINLSLSLAKRKLAEKNEWNLSNQSGEVTHASIYLTNCRRSFIFFSYLI